MGDWYVGLLALAVFHFAFFRQFYFVNPWCYATSELVEQVFPSWRLLGQRGADDPYYYPHYGAIPFLSALYPPHRLTAWVGSRMSLDHSFLLLCGTLLCHFLWASVGGYLLFRQCGALVAWCGAVTLTHNAYCVKQNSTIIYTLAWIPWLLHAAYTQQAWLFGVSMGMIILAGYWPIGIYAVGLGCLLWLWH